MNQTSLSRPDTIPDFLMGGGEMGQRIRDFDWTTTSIGPIHTWPKSLQTCIRIMLTSRQPIWIGWGTELIKFYNDPYKAIVGGKHPRALGQPASVVWKDIWRDIEPMLRQVMEENTGTYVEQQLLIMERNGYPEETYYTFSYTPIPGDDGGTAGMICANTDDTDRLISERQLKTITNLGRILYDSKNENDVFSRAIKSLKTNSQDFPFAILYKLTGDTARLSATTIDDDCLDNVPTSIDIKGPHEIPQLLAQAMLVRKPQVLTNVLEKIGNMPKGAWQRPPDNALIISIPQSGQKDPYGFLIVGLNPYRILNESYENFFKLIADQIATSLSNVHALEEERKRREALAEIDRAKTTFFSNISHEFRTPLTLLLGPIQDALNEPDAIRENKQRLEIAHRNAIRMQKLVNMLLDFSRIEEGRVAPKFSPVDIAALTSDLASTFRSAIEKAGMTLLVNCETIFEPVYVDVEMWEKIVLNLVSNALKYSDQGTITVSLTRSGNDIELVVSDTGTGIAESELEKIFERFHRIQNVKGRSQEGSGIGLAMVKELVNLQGGDVQVKSKLGEGSAFVVTLPIRRDNNPDNLTKTIEPVTSKERLHQISKAYTQEALQWLETSEDKTEEKKQNEQKTVGTKAKPTILLVDDNVDMRFYIQRLLADEYTVIQAMNGEEGFTKAMEQKPELIISDIMMPVLDGFGLLEKIRNHSTVRDIPVIFLSARAGEESRVEGLQAGADDYLVKPFSSKELLAKISSQIKITRVRKKTQEELKTLFNQAPVAIAILRGANFELELANEFYLSIIDKDRSVIGKSLFEAIPELQGQGIETLLNQVFQRGEPYVGNELPVDIRRKGSLQKVYFNFVYYPLKDENGKISGVIVVANDVTDLVSARETARLSAILLENKVVERTLELQREKEFAEIVMSSSVDLMMVFDTTLKILAINKKVEETYGIAKEDAVGRSLPELFPNMTLSDYEGIEKAKTGEVVHAKTYSPGKIDKYFESFLIPLKTSAGNVYAVLSTAHDITELVKASEQIRQSAEQLEKANESLLHKNRELEQFAYVSSHDLQEPLRKIQTFTELVKKNFGNPEYVKMYLDKIDSSASRMSALIKDVLQYSRVSNQEKKFENVDLNEILDNVKMDFELLIEQKNATIVRDPLPTIVGNKLQLHQLFFNLIGNSLKFSEKNPVIHVHAASVTADNIPTTIRTDPKLTYTLLTFADNGIGFDEQYSEQIFGLFNRLHNRKDYSGTGIGLALCRRIVENHNGIITANSQRGKGSVFKVYFPV